MKKIILILLLLTGKGVEAQISFVPKTVFKFDPVQMVTSGELNMSLEQKIARQFSIEADFGLLQYNFIRSPFDGYLIDNLSTNSELGGFASLGIRFYPLNIDEAPSGLYIEPQFKYRSYHFYYDGTYYNGEDPKGTKKQTIGSFNLGYQLWVADRFAFDFYGSIGVKMSDFNGLRNEETLNGYFEIKPYSEKRSDVAIVLGIKFSTSLSKY